MKAYLLYTQPDTGAIERSQYAKNTYTLNIEEFGDDLGTTDDTVVIQTFLDAVGARGGGKAYLPPLGKPYKLTSGSLNVPAGVTLCGAAIGNYIGFSATTYVDFEGLHLHNRNMVRVH